MRYYLLSENKRQLGSPHGAPISGFTMTPVQAAQAKNYSNLLIVVGCACYVLAIAYVPRFADVSPVACQWHRYLGLHCPTCGLTRAIACLARLDLASAIRFNPLVVLVAPWAIAFTLNALAEAAGVPTRVLLSRRMQAYGWWVLLLGVVMLFVARMATWVSPDLNPGGWLLPPSDFPA